MPGLIDCAILLPAHCEAWLADWIARSSVYEQRLRLHRYELAYNARSPVNGHPRVEALRDADLALRRYDVALLPVSYANLSWARTALAAVPHSQRLPVPLLALVRDLRAAAIQDLFDLGVADFVREDASMDDVRVRAAQLVATRSACYDLNANAPASGATTLIATTLPEANALSWDARTEALETFRVAKRRVIANFERHYLIRALMRHAGNISMAARAAQKHRRAFWELLRKHQIDADAYRDVNDRDANYRDVKPENTPSWPRQLK